MLKIAYNALTGKKDENGRDVMVTNVMRGVAVIGAIGIAKDLFDNLKGKKL